MKKASELPVAVNNLRRIWNYKKAEMKFTQVQAAEKLGWSQGAISHYLNNITELGPAATIKFANFLGVDPEEIDPTVKEHLPNTRTRVIKYDINNMKQPINRKFYDRKIKDSFWVECLASDYDHLGEKAEFIGQCHVQVCSLKDFPDAKLVLVKKKNVKRARLYTADNAPTQKVEQVWAVLETSVSNTPI